MSQERAVPTFLNGDRGMLRVICAVLLFFVSVETTVGARPLRELFESGEQGPSASSQPAAQRAAAIQPIARVNGETISYDEFTKILYASAGARVLRQMVALAAVRQVAQNEKIELTAPDFDREVERILSEISPGIDATGRKLTPEDRQRILQVILKQRGISRDEFDLGIKRQAYLRAVARKQLEKMVITEDQLKAEYDHTFGPRRDIRAIVVNKMELAQRVHAELGQGLDFSKLAEKYSQDVASGRQGGRIGVVGRSEPGISPEVLQVVFGLAEGSFSPPIKVGDVYWLVQVDTVIPPEPRPLSAVKDDLKKSISARVERQLMERIDKDVLIKSEIKIRDRFLADEFGRWLDNLDETPP